MAVEIDTLEDEEIYTLYFGNLIEVGKGQQPEDKEHYKWLDVYGTMVWDEEEEVYIYTITVTWRPDPGEPNIKLEEVGVRLPLGYEYVEGSADEFDSNPPAKELSKTEDQAGAQMLNWELKPPLPQLSDEEPTQTQTFYVAGEGELEGDYTWVNAQRSDVDKIGEVIGTLYSITATATQPGDEEPIARVRADVLWYEETGEISIIRWQINPEEE